VYAEHATGGGLVFSNPRHVSEIHPTAIGRVTANGSTTIRLKLYAVEGTSSAEWFARLKDMAASGGVLPDPNAT
jgi:hypothetical protein